MKKIFCIIGLILSFFIDLTAQFDSQNALGMVINAIQEKASDELCDKLYSQMDSLGIDRNDSVTVEKFFEITIGSLKEMEETFSIVFNKKTRVIMDLNSNKFIKGKQKAANRLINFIDYIDSFQKFPREQYEYFVYRYSIKERGKEKINAKYAIDVDENGNLIILHKEIQYLIPLPFVTNEGELVKHL